VNNDDDNDDAWWWEIIVMVRVIFYKKRQPSFCGLLEILFLLRVAKKSCQHLREESHTPADIRHCILEYNIMKY
jgi:hypothetical protein